MHRWKLIAALVLAVVAAVHCATLPLTFWEYDEHLFAMGVEHFDPLHHHPPPPGAPLYIAFARVVAWFTGDIFQALLVTSVLALVCGLVAFTAAFREIARSNASGVLGAALFYLSPALLVSGVLPQSDAGAIALYGWAIWACARGNPLAAGLACAAAVGWRPQFSVAVVPMFLTAVVLMRTWRDRAIAVAAFGVACLAWFVPLVVATGGPRGFWTWISGQAAYYAAHDAHLSRTGYSVPQLFLRFFAHPWGPKWLALPLLILAGAQVAVAMRKRDDAWKRALPLIAGCTVYAAFAIATMDPGDAVRYIIPALPLVALCASLRWRIAVAFVPLYAIGACGYVSPILRARATRPSPPAAAIRWIESNVPRDAIVMVDRPLRPHAEHRLRGWRTMHIDAALAQYGNDVATPMVIFADGERGDAQGVTFRWPDTDAYRKLTRGHYGSVSVIPFPPEQRFRVIQGVHPPERTRGGEAWRWVAARGTIELPDLGATRARFVVRAPPEYPFDANAIELRSGRHSTTLTVRRNASAVAVLPLETGASIVTITPSHSFVPAEVPGANNRDPRVLSVMLTRVVQEGRAP